ncbi:hypothetical protein SASPL_108176 [Salvia splendens]|uniref:S-formylglutathione hydrolase n=1 Tax=Salvia splendens TaxID=180675 RepID=A0A8X8YHM3_SALSN|nr:hypothetical protein SASPL_108176 [Salvia splendens]
MVGSIEVANNCTHSNGVVQSSNGSEEKLDELRRYVGKADGDLLKIVGVGGGAWGSVFAALLQDSYGQYRDKVQIRIWRRPGRAVDRATAEHLFEVINSREDVLRRLIRRCAYLKYVKARLGDRTLYADEILKDGFCLNMIDTPLCPMKVVTNLQEAVWDADIVINGLPSTEIREVFEEIRDHWKERITTPVIISLAKGIEAEISPSPRIITPTQMISQETGVPIENIPCACVLYWLSGLTCNDENFIAKSGAQRVASAEGVALIAPDTSPRGLNIEGEADSWDFGVGAGFYLNATQEKWKNWQMYDYVVKELPAVLKENFLQLDTSRASISGHSMGGHGALTIYLKNLDKYKSVSAFAPVANPINCPWGQKAFTNYLGENKAAWEEYDASILVSKYTNVSATILIDQGDADKFLSEQLQPQKFDEACRKSKVPLLLRMQPGYDHSYYFIATFIDDHIRHHAQALNL